MSKEFDIWWAHEKAWLECESEHADDPEDLAKSGWDAAIDEVLNIVDNHEDNDGPTALRKKIDKL